MCQHFVLSLQRNFTIDLIIMIECKTPVYLRYEIGNSLIKKYIKITLEHKLMNIVK